MEMKDSANGGSQIVDVGSVAEAVASENVDAPLYQLESLCMRCEENGTTRFLLTQIPHFRKILLSAFECPHCGERNNEVQFAGEIQPKGCHYLLEVPSGDQKMFNRQVVKSETATIKAYDFRTCLEKLLFMGTFAFPPSLLMFTMQIPELKFEIPPEAQRGSLSTVEGTLMRAADELAALQQERKKVDPHTAEAIDDFLVKLRACATAESSFTFILDDPAGNSFIENPFAPALDPSLTIKFYERTPEQQAALGYLVDPSQEDPSTRNTLEETSDAPQRQVEPHGSVGARAGRQAIAQGNSSQIADALFRYSAPEEIDIPYFQEVIVMASSCDACGYRNSEVKPGGRIPDKGKKIIVHVKNVKDLSRDVIKSDTASVKVPELDLELASGTLGGLVTTVEGLISKISESLERVHGFTFGDSLDDSRKSKWKDFRSKLDKLKNLDDPWTLVIDDALSNSFVAPATDEIKDDTQLIFEEYERSWEQNEDLGLNDMDTSAADIAYDFH
ncbi:ZPR1 zinc-finger domain protein [Striga asiatica]|uniref:ZPR1 zinc-finger domain protein n=1 Tax=Striga asiatica TaxID=4170 RepID=A0A5A7RJH6_STRAF|nr:ZPR1 zinc-finger domain protein [Striga asiatica]